MLNQIKFVLRYLKFLVTAKSGTRNLPSKISEVAEQVIYDSKKFYAFEDIKGIRQALEQNHEEIEITDFGAGSRINSSNRRKISDLAKNSAKAQKVGELMFKLVHHLQPKTMLELGTSLGISACYQAGGNTSARFVTMEGCPETAKMARKVFDRFGAKNIEIIVGDFSKTLDDTINSFNTLDYAFFDGNHQKEPTIEYFDKALKKANENSVFVFDDIHWSEGMEEAWKHIQKHASVAYTIDLFWIGLVFFKKEEGSGHYKLKL